MNLESYCTTVVPAGIGFATAAAVSRNSVPRVSVAKYRVPVPPGVTGSAPAQYELAGVPAYALHVPAAVPMSVVPVAPSFASATV